MLKSAPLYYLLEYVQCMELKELHFIEESFVVQIYTAFSLFLVFKLVQASRLLALSSYLPYKDERGIILRLAKKEVDFPEIQSESTKCV